MPGSHWMLVLSPENWAVTRARGLDVIGLRQRHRRKAERMAPGDRILFYVTHQRVFTATATVTSTYFEDHAPLWKGPGGGEDDYAYRVRIEPNVVLEPAEHIDAYEIAPRLLYVKRWPPEDWPLAFQGDIHLLSSADYRLIEGEMERLAARRAGRDREPPPAHPSRAAPVAPAPGGG